MSALFASGISAQPPAPKTPDIHFAVTPQPLLGRMTSTMRWLILIPAAPGALAGGWLGEHFGLRWALAAGGAGALLLGACAYAFSGLRHFRELPVAREHE